MKDRSRSQSEDSSDENSPPGKSKVNKVSNSQISVSMDNIESYENSVENCDNLIWIEKTKESVDKKTSNRNNRLESLVDDCDTRNKGSDSEDNSYRKKHKKSKKHKRSKES